MRYQFRALSSSTGTKTIVPRTLQSSPKQEFEIDFQGPPSEATSEIGMDIHHRKQASCTTTFFITDIASTSSSRHSVVSLGSVSSCGDTLTPRNSWASLDLRHSAGDPLIPEILEHTAPEAIDQLNESRRQVERQNNIFLLNTSDVNEGADGVEKRAPANSPIEHIGHRILVKCLQLT